MDIELNLWYSLRIHLKKNDIEFAYICLSLMLKHIHVYVIQGLTTMLKVFSLNSYAIFQIHLSFLYVGHTHEDIDEMFSTIRNKLAYNEALTLVQLIRLLPGANEVKELYDIKSWLSEYIVDIKEEAHTTPTK